MMQMIIRLTGIQSYLFFNQNYTEIGGKSNNV